MVILNKLFSSTMPIKPYQSARAADLGTSCFRSAVVPAVSRANSLISHIPFALWPAVTLSAVQLAATPASLSVNTAVCISAQSAELRL